ncbi:sulfite exporter TauE/SafE family protein [Microbacterium sp. G2-8]|uniref:sulfite exporter TauE/SafE family protein n=1 Tax=Microbacterium sp. G2-8 TaxID=2842454 RepID=UPI001C8990DD|nr:sulfite exporter TauE/SafE family protein [Microbacterium sp. G2-8]
MSEWLPLTALGLAVFLGTATQRISGMGFALVASPFLVVLLGPFEGVLVVNVFGALTALVVLVSVWRRVEGRRALLLLVPAVIATVPGAIVASLVPAGLLTLIIGVLTVVALCASLFARGSVRMMGRGGAIAAGAASGFMNVTAGVGGPAISAYAIATRWPQPAFAATVQLYFFVLGAASLAAKWALPSLSWQQWVVCGGAVGLGVAAGTLLAKVVGPKAARIMVIVLAFAGAIAVIAQGVARVLAVN